METLRGLREAVQTKRAGLRPNDWIIYHNNAPAHKTISVKHILAQKSITRMENWSYSSDFAPSDFWLFPKIKSALKGRRFQDTEDIQKNVMTILKAVPQQEFHRSKCIAAEGDNFKSQ